MNRRGITGVETVIIFLAAILTVAAFSFLVVTLGLRPAREPVIEETVLPVNVTIRDVLANATDPEFLDFFDYVFGTWEKISGVFESDFTGLRSD